MRAVSRRLEPQEAGMKPETGCRRSTSRPHEYRTKLHSREEYNAHRCCRDTLPALVDLLEWDEARRRRGSNSWTTVADWPV